MIDHDKAVAAFSILEAMKQYFDYEVLCGCGLPSITLLGSRSDWKKLANRVDKLHKYGEKCSRWAGLLQPIIRRMLRTFDKPHSQEVKDFWLRVAYEAGMTGSGGGICALSGWITAFTYSKDNGEVARDYKEEEISQVYGDRSRRRPAWLELWSSDEDRKRLVLDGMSYPLIRPADLPSGLVLLPINHN
jgi:hypothetical protein